MAMRRDGCVLVNITELVRLCRVGATLVHYEFRSSTWMDSTSTDTNSLASSVHARDPLGVAVGEGTGPEVLVVAPDDVLVGEAVGSAEQPFNARLTAMTSSLMATSP